MPAGVLQRVAVVVLPAMVVAFRMVDSFYWWLISMLVCLSYNARTIHIKGIPLVFYVEIKFPRFNQIQGFEAILSVHSAKR